MANRATRRKTTGRKRDTTGEPRRPSKAQTPAGGVIQELHMHKSQAPLEGEVRRARPRGSSRRPEGLWSWKDDRALAGGARAGSREEEASAPERAGRALARTGDRGRSRAGDRRRSGPRRKGQAA